MRAMVDSETKHLSCWCSNDVLDGSWLKYDFSVEIEFDEPFRILFMINRLIVAE